MTYNPNQNPEADSSADFSSENFSDRKTEWDEIGESVAFNENGDFEENGESVAFKTEGENEETEKEGVEFAKEKYGAKLEHLIETSCFEGGDRTDIDNYVWNMSLNIVMSDEDQTKLIENFSRSEEFDSEVVERLMGKISEKIENSSFAEEISSDPYLRGEKAKFLKGELGEETKFKANDPDWQLMQLLWKFDDEFYESEEAKNLLSDEKYLEKKYKVSERAEEDIEKYPKTTKEELEKKYLEGYAEALTTMVETGEASVEELLKDEYLRKRHFADLSYENIDEKRKTSVEIRSLWRADKEFYDSWEYRECIREKREARPDIYDKINMDEVLETTNERLEKLSQKDLIEIVKAYEKDTKTGDRKVLKTLAPILGLSRSMPTLTYRPGKDKEHGFYDRNRNLINICEENIAKKENEAKPIMENEESEEEKSESEGVVSSILDRLRVRPKKLEHEIFDRMGTVAHETWHAHQWLGENVSEERRAQYRENFVYYLSDERHGYESYRDQLIEAEAFAFGNGFMAKCTNVYFKERGGKYE